MFQRIAKPFRISIHALLAESDASTRIDTDNNSDFYPRSPCGERHQECSGSQHPPDFYPRSPCGERLFEYIQAGTGILFLSTLSLRRATGACIVARPVLYYFYPRSPCGERHPLTTRHISPLIISIHALLAESDSMTPSMDAILISFLSTLSLRRATRLPTALRTPHQRFLSTLSLRRATHCQC